MTNRYIGSGFIFEYLTKIWLADKFTIIESEVLDKSRKIDFIVEAEGIDRRKTKIGIQLTLNPLDTKLEYFIKSRNEILHNVDKAVYLQIDTNVAENEKRPEKNLITFILENIASIIRKEINGNTQLQAYNVSIYDFDKIKIEQSYDLQTSTSATTTATSPELESKTNATPILAMPEDASIASIIKKSGPGRPIIVQKENDTHIGLIFDECEDKIEIYNYLNNQDTSIIDSSELLRPLKVYVRMRKNKIEGKSDVAIILGIVR